MTYGQSGTIRRFFIIVAVMMISCQQVLARTGLHTITYIKSLSDALTLEQALGAANPAVYEIVAATNFNQNRSDYVALSWPTGSGIVYNSYSIKDNAMLPDGLFSGFLSTTSTTSGNTIRFENLQSSTGYKLFIYSQSNAMNDAVSLRVNGTGIGTLTTSDPSRTTFTEGVNYLEVSALSDEYGMISINYASSSGKGVINALQIGSIPNPEPGSIVLFAFGIVTLFSFRRAGLKE